MMRSAKTGEFTRSGREGATVSIYGNATISTIDPISFGYGVEAGFDLYAGAELYLKVAGKVSGTIDLNAE